MNATIIDNRLTGEFKMEQGPADDKKKLMVEFNRTLVIANGSESPLSTDWRVATEADAQALAHILAARNSVALKAAAYDLSASEEGEHTGNNVNYYVVFIDQPKRPEHQPYHAECEDIIQALGMTFSEGCAFKAIWRSAAERTLGLKKRGGDAVYDAEKTVHYGKLMLKERLAARDRRSSNAQSQTTYLVTNRGTGKIISAGTVTMEVGNDNDGSRK